jgi:hypothetical protein
LLPNSDGVFPEKRNQANVLFPHLGCESILDPAAYRWPSSPTLLFSGIAAQEDRLVSDLELVTTPVKSFNNMTEMGIGWAI